jgi:hypothetical protein
MHHTNHRILRNVRPLHPQGLFLDILYFNQFHQRLNVPIPIQVIIRHLQLEALL